jgi:hypothetical protein
VSEGGPLEDAVGSLVGAYAGERVDDLTRHHRRGLEGNEDGRAVADAAVRDAVRSALEFRLRELSCAGTFREPLNAARVERAWEEARERLELLGREPLPPGAIEEAEARMLEAGRQLGLATGAGRARRWRRVGRDAALAGAALAEVLAAGDAGLRGAPHGEPDDASPEREASIPAGDLVSVATVAHQAEGDLVQGLLADAGIPSTWRRVGTHLPDFLAAGHREILVAPAAAARARQALTAAAPPEPSDERRTRAVGLERGWLRVTGKVGALLTLAGGLFALPFLLSGPARPAAFAAEATAFVAIVAWTEHRRRQQR